MKNNKLNTIVKNIPFKVGRLVELQNEITEQILDIIKNTKGLNQKILAKKMNKTESYISRIVGGNVNMTLSTIVDFEEVLGQDILVTPLSIQNEIRSSEAIFEKVLTVDSSFNNMSEDDLGEFIQGACILPTDKKERSKIGKFGVETATNYGNVAYA